VRLNSLAIAVFAMLFAVPLSASPVQSSAEPGYSYFVTGDVGAATPQPPSFGILMIGGSDWSPPAWRWFLEKAGHGHLVILRASQDGSDGEWIFNELGGIASVQTLVFTDRSAAFDPRVEDILLNADGVFIAGGDQSNYVRFWKDTPVEAALNAHAAQGRPLGGTSAGLAILGGAGYGAMAEYAVDSPTALADPFGEGVTLVRDFLDLPFLEHVITDTHFSERGRLGRLIAFIAQSRATGDPQAVGIGIDEDSALAIDADGTGRFYTLSGGHAWLVEPVGAPGFAPDGALDWQAVTLTAIGPDSVLDIKSMQVQDPAVSAIARVEHGALFDAPTGRP
jgi:beta-aspartyl-peptidase (threonine type)